MGMISTELKVKLHKTFKQLLPACDLRVIWKTASCMKSYFNFKDKIKRELCYINISVTAAMLETLVKPNNTRECEPPNIWVFVHSQENVSKVTFRL